jgi:hypothetical protein
MTTSLRSRKASDHPRGWDDGLGRWRKLPFGVFTPYFNVKRHYALRTNETSHPGSTELIYERRGLQVHRVNGLRGQECGFIMHIDNPALLVRPTDSYLAAVPKPPFARHGFPTRVLEVQRLWVYAFRCKDTTSYLLLSRIVRMGHIVRKESDADESLEASE